MAKPSYAEKTREQRCKLAFLVQSGLSEGQALAELFPDDPKRSRKLKTWKERGLWPIEPSGSLVGGQSPNDQPETCSQSLPQEKLPEPEPTTETFLPPTPTTEEKTKMLDLLSSPEVEPLLSAVFRKFRDQEKEHERKEAEALPIRNKPQPADNVFTIPLEADGFPVLLPPPRMDGKRCLDPRTKFGGTVLDARLAKLLEKLTKQRGVQLSRVFDSAIWYFLGQPELENVKLEEKEQEGEGEPAV